MLTDLVVVGYNINMTLQIYDIPDPFQVFVANKYANAKGAKYDFFSGEWDFNCLCCNEMLTAPNKKTLNKMRLYHTRSECLGGW